MRKYFFTVYAVVFLMFTVSQSLAEQAPAQPVVPVKDMVTLVDLGANSCIPCKMMAPLLEELKKEYEGRAAVLFIDVWKDRSQGKRFGIRSIPTQIFYDKSGQEVYRHKGFLSKEKMKSRLDMLLTEK